MHWIFSYVRIFNMLLWNANPWIPPGTAVQVWGTPSGQGPCGATSIQVTSWKPGKNIKCKA